jgi:hypothetical protein
MKFSLHFCKIYTIYYEFLKFKQISWKLNWKTEFEKKVNAGTVSGRLLSQCLALLAWPNGISARPAHATGAARACPSGGHRARVEHSGAPTGGPPAVRLAPQAPVRYGSLAGQGHGDTDAMERRAVCGGGDLPARRRSMGASLVPATRCRFSCSSSFRYSPCSSESMK